MAVTFPAPHAGGSRLDRVTFLAAIATRLLMDDHPEDIAAELYAQLAAHLDLDLYLNYLVSDDPHWLRLEGSTGLSDEEISPIRRIAVGEAVCGNVARHSRPIIAEHIQASEDPMLSVLRSLGVAGYACHPLVGRSGLIGTLGFGSRQRDVFSRDEIELMATVASQAAVAIERARLFDALTQSERRLRVVLDVLPVAVFIGDAQGRIIQSNPAADRLWGGRPRGDSGPSCGDYRGWWPDTGRAIEAGEWGVTRAVREDAPRMGDEMDVETFDGRRLTILNYALPIHDDNGRIAGGVSVDVDITDRKRIERELQQANARKDVFLATLAHELRNPLAPIRYALRLLDAPEAEHDHAKARSVIDRQLAHLQRLVDDLLDVARITRNRIELRRRPMQLRAIVNQAFECSRPGLEQARHACSVLFPDDPIWVYADGDRLAQILTNLLNNATRYTPPGGRIVVSAERHDGSVRISVKDNGIGIHADDLPALFDLFTQATRVPHPVCGGLGIGLALAKGMAELHGGVLSASSDGPGRGSEFVLTLPVMADPQAAVTTTVERESAAPALRVLVVDDNVDATEMLQAVLGYLGHDVRVAYDGVRALAVAREYLPDVALLDIGLPGLDGYELAREMRRDAMLSRVRLIAITGWGQEEDRKRAWDAGFDEHLTKPADPDVLEKLLARS